MEKYTFVEALDSFFPNFDGPVHVVTNYCKSFEKDENVHVKIIVPKYKGYKDTLPYDIMRTKSFGTKKSTYVMAMPGCDKQVKKYFKENKVDLIHIHSPFTMGKYMVKMGKKYGIPVVYTFHTKFKSDFERVLKLKSSQKFMMNYIMKVINGCDYVLTVSDGSIDTLREYGYKGKVEVIRNGTDLKYPENPDELIKKVNEKYNLESEENVFLSVGRIVANKRLDVILNSLKIVKDKGYKFKLLVVGAGDYENELKSLCTKLDLDDCVIFTGKVMDREFLSAHYLRSDLFLFPSTFDTASLAPIEAAAMKLPTLMTRGCSTAEIINEDVNGYLANEEDYEDWANKIISIIEDKKKLKEVSDNAYTQVYRTWDNVVDEVKAKYIECIEDYKSKHIKK